MPFNKKTGVAKFDGITYKKVKYVGFTSDSRQILIFYKSGRVKIVPRAKGTIGKKYKEKTLAGKWNKVAENTKGLTIRVVNTTTKVKKGVKNAQPKKL